MADWLDAIRRGAIPLVRKRLPSRQVEGITVVVAINWPIRAKGTTGVRFCFDEMTAILCLLRTWDEVNYLRVRRYLDAIWVTESDRYVYSRPGRLGEIGIDRLKRLTHAATASGLAELAAYARLNQRGYIDVENRRQRVWNLMKRRARRFLLRVPGTESEIAAIERYLLKHSETRS